MYVLKDDKDKLAAITGFDQLLYSEFLKLTFQVLALCQSKVQCVNMLFALTKD